MQCPKCGAEVRDQVRFCDNCGLSLEEYGVMRDSATGGESQPAKPGGMDAAARKRMIIAFVMFDFILAVGLVVFFLRMG